MADGELNVIASDVTNDSTGTRCPLHKDAICTCTKPLLKVPVVEMHSAWGSTAAVGDEPPVAISKIEGHYYYVSDDVWTPDDVYEDKAELRIHAGERVITLVFSQPDAVAAACLLDEQMKKEPDEKTGDSRSVTSGDRVLNPVHHVAVPLRIRGRLVPIDAGIAPLVAALNKVPHLRTTGSCEAALKGRASAWISFRLTGKYLNDSVFAVELMRSISSALEDAQLHSWSFGIGHGGFYSLKGDLREADRAASAIEDMVRERRAKARRARLGGIANE